MRLAEILVDEKVAKKKSSFAWKYFKEYDFVTQNEENIELSRERRVYCQVKDCNKHYKFSGSTTSRMVDLL